MKNRVEDLRNHLFATIEGLLNEDDPMDIDRAKAVSEVAKTMIDSARAENDFLRIMGDIDPQKAVNTGFISNTPKLEDKSANKDEEKAG